MNKKPTCQTCPHFQSTEAHERDSGLCRALAARFGQGNSGWRIPFPLVHVSDWCAEHPAAPMTRTQSLLALIAERMGAINLSNE